MECDDLIKLQGVVGFGNGLVGNFQGVLLHVLWSTAEQKTYPPAPPAASTPVIWIFFFSDYQTIFLSPSLWDTTQYRLKYCLKGSSKPKQATKAALSKG